MRLHGVAMNADSITYILMGDPIPLARARHHNRKVYDSQKNDKLVTGISLRNQHDDRPLIEGPISLNVTFYMPIAKSREKQRKALLGTPNFYKPDLSNLLKYVEDCANAILYKDDCQIVEIIAKKIYGEPRTEFTITKIAIHG